MVIFHVDEAKTWRGGQRQVFALHQGVLAQDVDSRVVCRRGGELHRRLVHARLPHYALGVQGPHDIWNARRIGLLAKEERGIVHAHSSHAHDFGLWARRLGGAPALVVSRRINTEVGRNWWSRRKYRSRHVDLYLAISSAVESELRSGGVDPGRVRLVPSGIDFSRMEDLESDWRWKQTMGLAPGELLWGCVAALTPEKDLVTLLLAFARFRERGGSGHLAILGEGPCRGELEELRSRLGLSDRVHLPGFVDPVLPAMKAFDIFVLTSRIEGLGTSLLDAMGLGLPVIGSRTGGIVDVVADEQSGLLFETGDPASLAESMRRMQSDAPERRRLAEAARRRAEDFDMRITVQKTLNAYLEIAPRR
jgi:glycosyltransferase involved in cell wall biosynthesis